MAEGWDWGADSRAAAEPVEDTVSAGGAPFRSNRLMTLSASKISKVKSIC